MRINPIAAARDWSKKRAYKKHLLESIRHAGPCGGVDIPQGDDAHVWAVAVQELLTECPQLSVVRTKDHLTLCRRAEIGGLSADLRRSMATAGALPEPGEDLTNTL